MYNLKVVSREAFAFFNETMVPSLTARQKQITLVVVAALLCLAALYAWFRCCNGVGNDDQKKGKPGAGGAVMTGKVVNGKLQGQGKKTYADGRVLEGNFRDSVLHGQGTKTFANGSIAKGLFEDGEFVAGTFEDRSTGWPSVSEGKFVDYALHGRGERTDVNDHVEIGEFVKGKFVKGRKTLRNDGLAEGEFEDGKLHGQGKYTASRTQPCILIKEGQFFHGFFVKGKKIDHVGNVMEGDFATITPPGDFVRKEHGEIERGKITYRDGTIEEGTFHKKHLEGRGKRTKPDGTVEDGFFHDGVLQS